MNLTIKETPCEQIPVSLLLEADPSEEKIHGYLNHSIGFTARADDQIVAACLIIPVEDSIYELINIAVEPEQQGKGIGRKLLAEVISAAKALGASKLILGTGTFGHQLTFYQRAGFRAVSVDRDFFLTHYQQPIIENGIQHKDMLRLELDFEQ